MERHSAAKTPILKTKSGRISYHIRNFTLTDRFDINRLCAEERTELLTPVSRACFRNRFTFILLLLFIGLSMLMFSRIFYSLTIPPTMLGSFLMYRIAKFKHKIKAPFQHPIHDYTEALSRRRILVAVITVEDENDIMHEKDLIGFIAFASHPTDRQAALITHLYVNKIYRKDQIGHELLQTCRRVISQETQYQRLHVLCSGYQQEGYKFLLAHQFFITDTWTTCVFVPGITDEQKMLSTTRLAPV